MSRLRLDWVIIFVNNMGLIRTSSNNNRWKRKRSTNGTRVDKIFVCFLVAVDVVRFLAQQLTQVE